MLEKGKKRVCCVSNMKFFLTIKCYCSRHTIIGFTKLLSFILAPIETRQKSILGKEIEQGVKSGVDHPD